MRFLINLSIACAVVVTAAAVPAQGGFQPGDLYLHSHALTSISSSGGGLMRIDPHTGATQIIVNYMFPAGGSGSAAYDPYRDRILVYAAITAPTPKLHAITASGIATDAGLPIQPYYTMAPRGDGIVYCRVGSTSVISYFDAANQVHTLMDATGATPYAFPGGSFSILAMVYHPGENALFAATQSTISVCAGGISNQHSYYKLPLSPDGSRVAGTVTCGQAIIDPAGAEVPVNWSLAPSGALFLVVDTNSNAQQPRMLLIDPVTLGASTFASNGSYIGAAATNAGVFSSALGVGVVLDTFNDVLRVFPAGSSGTGTVLATGVSHPGASGEIARLIDIQPAGVLPTLKGSVGAISLLAGGTQSLDFTPGAALAGEVYVVAGSVTGWTPGISVGGFSIPLVFDWYTDHTITNANLGPLYNNVGVLSMAGSSQAQLVVPPNAPPSLAGLTVYHAAVAFAPGFVLHHVSNPVALTLAP